ncbi:MAG: hypothetical protein QGG40_07010, partial [Myxococcota bacterium]|nr:hypothetical protein [Myxococcota bacterium]
ALGNAGRNGQLWRGKASSSFSAASDFWEDDEVNLIWDEDGSTVIGSRNGTSEAIYRLRTPDDVYTQFTSLEFSANKMFEDKWGMLSSYTWSRAYGTNDDHLATGNLDIPEQRQFEEGVLSFDRPHAIKIAGSYRDPYAWDLGDRQKLGMLFGWYFRMYSGLPYRPLYYNEYYGGWYNYGQINDGRYRLPAYSQMDLKGGLTLASGESTWDLTVECFNVFNDRTITDVEWTYADTDGSIYTDDDGDSLFGSPLDRQDPRYFQLGLRGEF